MHCWKKKTTIKVKYMSKRTWVPNHSHLSVLRESFLGISCCTWAFFFSLHQICLIPDFPLSQTYISREACAHGWSERDLCERGPQQHWDCIQPSRLRLTVQIQTRFTGVSLRMSTVCSAKPHCSELSRVRLEKEQHFWKVWHFWLFGCGCLRTKRKSFRRLWRPWILD